MSDLLPRARVTISFDYPIQMEYYPSGEVETPADAVAFDQSQYDDGEASIQDLIGWADPDTTSVTIEIEES